MRDGQPQVTPAPAEGCMYCGNTGTANARPCPVCNGG